MEKIEIFHKQTEGLSFCNSSRQLVEDIDDTDVIEDINNSNDESVDDVSIVGLDYSEGNYIVINEYTNEENITHDKKL